MFDEGIIIGFETILILYVFYMIYSLKGIEICRPGVPFKEIGYAIAKHANANDFRTFPAVLGHGIGYYFHGPPDIYHCRKKSFHFCFFQYFLAIQLIFDIFSQHVPWGNEARHDIHHRTSCDCWRDYIRTIRRQLDFVDLRQQQISSGRTYCARSRRRLCNINRSALKMLLIYRVKGRKDK